jgi:hypothetical protein
LLSGLIGGKGAREGRGKQRRRKAGSWTFSSASCQLIRDHEILAYQARLAIVNEQIFLEKVRDELRVAEVERRASPFPLLLLWRVFPVGLCDAMLTWAWMMLIWDV